MVKPTAVKTATRFSGAALFALAIITIMAATLFVASTPAQAAQASLAWDASAGSTGYKVHIGSASGNYQQHIDVGSNTSYLSTQLAEGSTYYFAVSAYNASGVQSGYSNEVSQYLAPAAVTHTITATAGSGGAVTALNNTKVSTATSGTTTLTSVTVTDGASQGFGIAAATGYRIADVKVDGVSVGAVASYTFTTVKAAHSIAATFTAAITSYTITATAGTGGTITPAGASSVTSGGSKSYSIVPAAGYKIAGVSVNGTSVGAVASYTFTNVTANHTISASFAANPVASYSITATATAGGTITPAGTATVTSGGSKSYTIAPATGYRIESVKVNGVSVGTPTSYTFSNVTANKTIAATFVAAAGRVVFATNSGGAYFKDSAAVAHSADARYTGGDVKSSTVSIAGTVDDTLYQSYRYGNSFSYNVPLANGAYSVTLKFADNSLAGQRVFDVKMEGLTVLGNLDIFARAGNNTAYNVTVPVNVADGTLNIGFLSKVGNAKINAIVIKTR